MFSRAGNGATTSSTSFTATVPPGAGGTSILDVDSQQVKYMKRRSVKNSPQHVLGLMILFVLVLSIWHYSTASLQHKHEETIRHTRLRAELLFAQQGRRLEESFRTERNNLDKRRRHQILSDWLEQLDLEIRNNVNGGIRWIRPYLLPTLGQDDDKQARDIATDKSNRESDHPDRDEFLEVERHGARMKWEDEWESMLKSGQPILGPIVDYTDHSKYTYPAILPDVPSANVYPPLKPLGDLMANWNHDEDFTGIIHEELQHFNYSDPSELAMAKKYRDAEVPFKLYSIPEVDAATQKWTDEYVDAGFRSGEDHGHAHGHAQESPNNYFAFFIGKKWVVNKLGLAPVRNSDWGFAKFASHARYADAVRLSPDMPHFYWQSGVPREQRTGSGTPLGFISRDLPSFSSKAETFFLFHPDEQKGIQCRFGERGVVAATHYDSGMNFVAMITGAKRYILQPPRECSKLGLFTSNHSPIYRHSLLNFAHMKYLDDNDTGMSDEERAWLEKAAKAQSVETVLKQGEALYIPSHWFHYIVSLQKSGQCNVRSGINYEGHPVFGNRKTVEECRDP